LKPERWGSPLVQEKYQEEKACDKRQPYRITTTIIIIITTTTAAAAKTTSDPDSNIIYGSNSKVTITKSNKI